MHYSVDSPNELTNSWPDLQKLFKGGNCLDIQLATDPSADANRTTPAIGDIRVLVTRQNGKAIAVVYRPKVVGPAATPIVFTSPTGSESFDRIEIWNDVALSYEKTATGFEATVTLPLAKLGFTPVPGSIVRMDLGYIFGNETGNTTATRAYWSNHSMTAGVVQDVPNEARLEPSQWGKASVE